MNVTSSAESSARDFDFLIGTWRVHNRYLRHRLVGSDVWDEFESSCTARRILDGFGNQDEFRISHGGGFVGMSFRFFDPVTREWAIYWADSRRPGQLDPPMVGAFSEGSGVFKGFETIRGTPVVVRFIWSRVASDSPRWEQAFSVDGEKTWETNWVMDFERSTDPGLV